ncbi:MAG: bifunctional alpha,alpha-trehalose-phosphate synthase (UDP-forming)/trehalose-phosphatase [Candidatus Saccharimonadales bacterium]
MGNLVIVSNRLPVSAKRVDGVLEFYASTGGLATGLSSYTTKSNCKWIGWPGIASDDLTFAERKLITKELKRRHCYPVFLTQKQLDEYYNGYSNSVLWPLFHDLPIKSGHTPENWQAYQDINQLFADAVLELSEPGSNIWVHDYQLLLTPLLIRQARPSDRIGFFLHIPFPASKKLAAIEQAKPLIEGILGANLVGFHTSSYSKNFLDSCRTHQIGIITGKQVALAHHVVQVTEFPIGIDYERFASGIQQRGIRSEYRKLQWKYRGKKVILTVDRLDPTKGLAERLLAYEKLLEQNPNLHNKVVLVMIASPSRTEIDVYKALKVRVEKIVKRINTKFGSSRWEPVEYIYNTLPIESIIPLYERADVAFIAPIRDGMNLVAKEYLASKPKHNGVLVLSSTAGAAEELKDAVLVNPKQPWTLVDGLSKALTMPKHELKRRASSMQNHVQQFTVQAWADSFIRTLQRPRSMSPSHTKHFGEQVLHKVIAQYHGADRRLLLFDYDGVLREFVADPAKAKPTTQIKKLLRRLGGDPSNDLVIVSGRSRDDLTKWFGDLPIALAAEHGAYFRRRGGKNWHKTTNSSDDWQKPVTALFEQYAEMTPGALVERKRWSIVWHYRGASAYYSQKHLVILRRLLAPVLKVHNLQITEGNKVLEVHPNDISKGRVVQEWLIHDHDFVLCIGDDVTDEDMFASLPAQAVSIKVGRGTTKARYRLKDVPDVLSFLSRL